MIRWVQASSSPKVALAAIRPPPAIEMTKGAVPFMVIQAMAMIDPTMTANVAIGILRSQLIGIHPTSVNGAQGRGFTPCRTGPGWSP